MSGKRLLPLAAILVVLVVVALTVKRQPTPTRLVDEVGWERLVPDSLQADSITGVDLYQGSLPDQVLTLRRQGDRWQVQSYFAVGGDRRPGGRVARRPRRIAG